MASTIKIKNGTSGAPSSLAQGELAININNGSLFFGTENSSLISSSFTFSHVTASGIIKAEHFLSTDDAEITDDLTVGGDLDVAGEIECDHLNIADIDDGIHFGDTQVLHIDASNNVNFGVPSNSAVDLELYGHNHTYTAGGSITLDAGGDITLDAAGDDINFADNGTTRFTVNTLRGDITASGGITSSGAISTDGNLSSSANVIANQLVSNTINSIGNVTRATNIAYLGSISQAGNDPSIRLTNTYDVSIGDADEAGDGTRIEVKESNQSITLFGDVTSSGAISGSNNLIMPRQFDLPGANGMTQGDITYFGSAGTDFASGKLHYLRSNSQWFLADKDAELTSGAVLLAFALGAAPSNGMLLRGMFRYGSDLGSVGDRIYVGDSGVPTNDVSGFTTGDFIRIIGYLLGGTNGELWFNPDNTYIEKA